MIHDTVSAIHLARQVALNLYPNVVVTTPLAIGISEHWMDHKGTLEFGPFVVGARGVTGSWKSMPGS
jgi:creatinine amidohydrolase/Fe(II)-dependent formamide hydrolase-like protein